MSSSDTRGRSPFSFHSDGGSRPSAGVGVGVADACRSGDAGEVVYESGEGFAGGLADVAPIGKYIVQKHRTGDDPVQSGLPKDLVGGETSESASGSGVHKEGSEKERRFTL